MAKLAPVVITVFNRADHTEQTLKALENNLLASETEVHIFSDYWDRDEDKPKVLAVREVIGKNWKFKKTVLHEATKRRKLGSSVINAVDRILADHDAAIVMEDDLITSSSFLKYMNGMLAKYASEPKVGSIAGYSHNAQIMNIPEGYNFETYFCPRPSSWGWATWANRWNIVDWDVSDFGEFSKDKQGIKKFEIAGGDLFAMLKSQQEGETNSWAIRWAYHHYKHALLSVYPIISYINNIGLDGSGSNFKGTERPYYANDILNREGSLSLPPEIEINTKLLKSFKRVYAQDLRYYVRKIKGKLKI